jgi:hypothetical protein
VRFESKKLSKIINAYYEIKDGIATVNDTIFYKAPEVYKLAYVESAYKRFGDKNRISMSNAGSKIQMLGKLLKELGCTDVITYYVPAVPTLFRVIFTPNALVKNQLKIAQVLTKNDILPELEAQEAWEEELLERRRGSVYFDVSPFYIDGKSNWNIKYRGPSETHIKISVYNIYGNKIEQVINAMYDPQKHSYYPWDTQDYKSGIYFFKLEVDGIVQTTKKSKVIFLN